MHTYYSKMYSKGFSHKDIIKAGYFQHPKINTLTDVNFNRTIEDGIKSFVNKVQNTNINIAVITGCFNPIHQGHLNNLIIAKQHIKSINKNPTLCIICPAHESYSSTKNFNNNNLHSRINQIKKAIENQDNCLIDTFPATKYSTDVNFTYIIERYLQICQSLSINAKVFFTYGSDNAEFGYVLATNNTYGICIKRNNEEERMNAVIDKLKQHKCNTKYIINIMDNEYDTLNSSSIRNNQKVYLIRNDLHYALPNTHPDTLAYYADTISYAFSEAFKEINIQVKVINAQDQMNLVTVPENTIVISLDKFFKGDFNANLSRVFTPNTYQASADKFYFENENEFISFIIECDQNGIRNFLVVDDDISSGSTTAFIEQFIRKLTIKEPNITFQYLNLLWLKKNNLRTDCVYDIVDMRDFVYNSLHGGLLCSLGNTYKRFLYYAPEVNLTTRANIPEDKIGNFIQCILQMNEYKIYAS